MIDSNSTSNQLRDFRTELNKVSTDTLVQRFSNLSGAIEDFIKTLQPEISYDQDVYSVANDIAWNRLKDYNKPITNETFYKIFNLNTEEIKFIENTYENN